MNSVVVSGPLNAFRWRTDGASPAEPLLAVLFAMSLPGLLIPPPTPMVVTYPDDPFGPDELIEQKMLWPDTRVVPFHYPHPTTGKQVADDDLRAPHYGQDVYTAPPALSLQLPRDQQEKLKENGSADISGVTINGAN